MSDRDHTTGWFLAQTKPNSHMIALRNLARQGFSTFLPLQQETRRMRGKFDTRVRPLFPGYVFVALDLVQGSWRAVNATQGITRLVSLGTAPTPVPDELVRQLKQRCDADGLLQPQTLLKTGDAVTVTAGPFTDFVATIDRIDPDKRIWVLMDVMGAKTRVAVGADAVRSV